MPEDELTVLAYYYFKGELTIKMHDGTTAILNPDRCAQIMEMYRVVGLDYKQDRMVRKLHD